MRDKTGLPPLLTVIIPVFNEAATVEQLLNRVMAAPYEKQIIVVDDGSIDATPSLLAKWSANQGITLFTHSLNQGKGQAIRTALEHAAGTFTIIQDADLEYDPNDYPRLIEPLRSGKLDLVLGSRYLRGAGRDVSRAFLLGVWALNIMVWLLYQLRLTDEATCYKATSTAVLRRMRLACERFEFCPELIAKAARMQLRIAEVPISYHPRGKEAAKKIRLRDGWAAINTLWRWRQWTESSVPHASIKRAAKPLLLTKVQVVAVA